jgi:hypothetical protein
MRNRRNLLTICSALVVASLWAQTAWSGEVTGKVTFLGTIIPRTTAEGGEVRFRFVVNSTCDTDTTRQDRFIVVRQVSFLQTPSTTDETANFRNTYSTLLAALLAGNDVHIDGVVSCDASQEVRTNQIGVGIIAVP